MSYSKYKFAILLLIILVGIQGFFNIQLLNNYNSLQSDEYTSMNQVNGLQTQLNQMNKSYIDLKQKYEDLHFRYNLVRYNLTLKEIIEPSLISWGNWSSYPHGQTPTYDEYRGKFSQYSYPDGLGGVYVYLLTGQTTYLDIAVSTLKFTAQNLINQNGVLMLYDQNKSSASSTPMPPGELYACLIAITYIQQLEPVDAYAKKIGDAALKFQAPTGLFAGRIYANGSIMDSLDDFSTRSLASSLFRFYEVTGDSRYLSSGLKLVDGLWGLRTSENLIREWYNVKTGSVSETTTRCHTHWQFCGLAKYAYLLTGDKKYHDIYQAALQAMHKKFWFNDHWSYRTGYDDLWEYYQSMVAPDMLGMREFTNENLIDIGKRVVQKKEISSLGLIMHAVDNSGKPRFNWDSCISNQMASVLGAWAYGYLGNGTNGYETALELYRALIKYHKKSHGFVGGIDALTGDFYHKWGEDSSSFGNGIMMSWCAAPLVLNIRGDIKLDFGHGFNTPYSLGGSYDRPLMDINKFRINIRERYVKVTVQSGSGYIALQISESIHNATKDGMHYNNFGGNILTIDGSGIYLIHF